MEPIIIINVPLTYNTQILQKKKNTNITWRDL
jgi:hypothetical protein